MSQQDIINFLKRSPGTKYTALELQKNLEIGTSLYTNLRDLRPQCLNKLHGVDKNGKPTGLIIAGSPKTCPKCGNKINYNSSVRCIWGVHIGDCRVNAFFYWHEAGQK